VIDERLVGAALNRDIALGEKVEHEPTAMISRHPHERRAWTGSDGYALGTSRLRDYARRRGGVGS
jgi:hypothetical protein